MKNTKRYLSIFLALALAAPVFTGCDNGLDEYKSGETIAPPSDKFNAEIQFVTRLNRRERWPAAMRITPPSTTTWSIRSKAAASRG